MQPAGIYKISKQYIWYCYTYMTYLSQLFLLRVLESLFDQVKSYAPADMFSCTFYNKQFLKNIWERLFLICIQTYI